MRTERNGMAAIPKRFWNLHFYFAEFVSAHSFVLYTLTYVVLTKIWIRTRLFIFKSFKITVKIKYGQFRSDIFVCVKIYFSGLRDIYLVLSFLQLQISRKDQHYSVLDIISRNYSRYTFGPMVRFGPLVWSCCFLFSVLWFLYIRSSGFGPIV